MEDDDPVDREAVGPVRHHRLKFFFFTLSVKRGNIFLNSTMVQPQVSFLNRSLPRLRSTRSSGFLSS